MYRAQVSPAHVYYQTQQQENVSHSLQQQQIEHSLAQVPQLHGDSVTQQQDSGMSLQEFFKSPEAIQVLTVHWLACPIAVVAINSIL